MIITLMMIIVAIKMGIKRNDSQSDDDNYGNNCDDELETTLYLLVWIFNYWTRWQTSAGCHHSQPSEFERTNWRI